VHEILFFVREESTECVPCFFYIILSSFKYALIKLVLAICFYKLQTLPILQNLEIMNNLSLMFEFNRPLQSVSRRQCINISCQ
jgi:hypothetical protein